MTRAETAYRKTLSSLYETALDPAAWPRFLNDFGKSVGACGAQFLVWSDATNAMGYTSVVGDFAADAAAKYGSYYGVIDPRRELLYARGDQGWLLCNEHFDDRFVQGSEFYNDFLIPVGARYLSVLHTFNDHGSHGTLGFLRPPDQAPFNGAEERQLFARVEGHVKRASRIWWKMKQLEMRADMGERALDTFAHGVFVVDSRGTVRFGNATGQAWLMRKPGIAVVAGKLRGNPPAADTVLARLIANATLGTNGAVTSGSMALPKPGAVAWQLFVVPLRHSVGSFGNDDPCAMVVIGDPNENSALDAEQLRALFSLTAAEARLSIALARGSTLEQYAGQVGLSINTVRTQLRNVLAKTGTHRQADLIRLLNAAPRVVGRP